MMTWIKTPGGLKNANCGSNMGVYARSDDGRYEVLVLRHLCGEKGRRSYQYTFEALDRGMPCAGRSYTDVPLKSTEHSDPKKVFAAVERYVAAQS